jgi:hypothetical protein
MITFIKKLTKVGNSKGFILDAQLIKSESLSPGKVYKLTLEEV